MANIKQQMKRDITNAKKRLANQSFNSSVKSSFKAFEEALATKDVEKATAAYSFACKKIDKAVTKSIYHKNWAARQKSQLAKKLNAIK